MIRIAAVAAVAIVLAVGVFLFMREPSGVDGAIAVLEDDDRFDATREAAEAFLDTSAILRESCADDDTRKCDPILQAAAYAQVLSFEIAGCTQPGVYDARQAMIGYLRAVQDTSNPEQPPLPEC